MGKEIFYPKIIYLVLSKRMGIPYLMQSSSLLSSQSTFTNPTKKSSRFSYSSSLYILFPFSECVTFSKCFSSFPPSPHEKDWLSFTNPFALVKTYCYEICKLIQKKKKVAIYFVSYLARYIVLFLLYYTICIHEQCCMFNFYT